MGGSELMIYSSTYHDPAKHHADMSIYVELCNNMYMIFALISDTFFANLIIMFMQFVVVNSVIYNLYRQQNR